MKQKQVLISVISFLLLHIIPKSILLKFLKRRINRTHYIYYPTFSGRVALRVLAEKFYNENNNNNTVLIPDYICNVVSKSFDKTKWNIITYRTNDILETDLDYLLNIIKECQPTVILGASIFGSSALIDLLKNKRLIVKIRERKIKVILDIAQDIRLIDELPTGYSDCIYGVISFNDKSFLGMMGGGVVTSQPLVYLTKSLTMKQLASLYYKLLIKTSSRYENKAINSSKNSFEYSFCQSFPYTFESYKIAKIQVILALIGLFNLKYYSKQKNKFLTLDLHLSTRFSNTAAYLILKNNNKKNVDHKIKYSYADVESPETSLRKDLYIIHNKGFYDYN